MMPTTNDRKHVIPAGNEASFTRKVIFEQFGRSINDIIPVASVSERAQVITALNAADPPAGPTANRPIFFARGDAAGLHRVEYTYDGVVFLPASGTLRFSSKAQADSFATANGGLLIVGDSAVIGPDTFVWQGTMWVPDGVSAPHWVARRTVAYSLTGGAQGAGGMDIDWDTVLYEGTLDGFETADWITFTCTVPGMYLLTAQAAAASTGTTFAGVFLNKNGADIALAPWTTNTTGVTSGTVVTSTRFKVGDRFKVRVSAGGPINGQTNLNQTKLTVNFLRA